MQNKLKTNTVLKIVTEWLQRFWAFVMESIIKLRKQRDATDIN